MNIHKIKITNKKNGFTLVELMVSMSIFMMVVLMALGALLTVSNTAKKSQALHQAMDNVNFAVESITRSLRTGTSYYCISSGTINLPATVTSDCVNGVAIAFIPQEHTTADTMYFFDSNEHSLKKCTTNDGCINITSSNVYVDNVKFFVTGTQLPSVGEYIQPSAYMIMKGRVTAGGETAEFSLQTMASQRSAE